MRVVKVGDIEVKVPKRYQDKVKAEKLISKLRKGEEIPEKPKTIRENNMLIPIQIDKKTTYFVRESKLYTNKWLQYFANEEELEAYILKYKNENGIN